MRIRRLEMFSQGEKRGQMPSAKRATTSSSRQTRTQSTYVRSIQRNGGMVLELKRATMHKSTDYKSLVEEVLGEDVEVRALPADVTLKVKNLNEVTERAHHCNSTRFRWPPQPFGNGKAEQIYRWLWFNYLWRMSISRLGTEATAGMSQCM